MIGAHVTLMNKLTNQTPELFVNLFLQILAGAPTDVQAQEPGFSTLDLTVHQIDMM